MRQIPQRTCTGCMQKKNKNELMDLFYYKINWEKVSFTSTNGALNLRTDLIMNQIIKGGFVDE